MPPPEPYKSEIGSQPTMCQVHTGTTDLDEVVPALPVHDASHAARHRLKGHSPERLDLFRGKNRPTE